MNENKNYVSSRSKIGAPNQVVDMDRNSKNKSSVPHHPLTKNSWTSMATKARRLSKKRKSSLLGSSRTKKESGNCLPKANQTCGKSLEDYTSWCDHYLLRGLHREVSPDLRTAVGDGVMLINLVETLTHKSIHGVSRQPMTWSQKLENIHVCFQFLKSEGVTLHGISPEDIIEGQLNSILNLFERLKAHFECMNYPGEKSISKNRAPNSPTDNGKNGRMSSGYHSEDDGFNDGRTTPVIDVLPGLLTGSETNSDDNMVEPSDIRLHNADKIGSSYHASSPNVFSPVSRNHRSNPARFHPGLDEFHNSANDGLDRIGYMPSHPSTKARRSPSKTKHDHTNDRMVNGTFHGNVANSRNAMLPGPEQNNKNGLGRDNFGMLFTASDFGIDDDTSVRRGSISSTGTPVLPDLSSTSSFEDLPLDFSSDASGFARENFATSTKLEQDHLSETSSYNAMDIQKQVESLHLMYQKLLVIVDKENQRKSKWNLPKVAAIQAKTKSTSKRRIKDTKSLSRRFARMESHVVTLARSVDHLRSEISSQADTSRQLDELRVDVNEFKDSIYSNNFLARHSQKSRDYEERLRRLQKLKRFFGEEPPMVALLLQKMGYERFIPHFKAEEIGFLELPYMTEQRLQNLGIPLGPRLRILEEIQRL